LTLRPHPQSHAEHALTLGTVIFLIATAANGSLAAEESTSVFLKNCLPSGCEHGVYLLLDGDPVLNSEYACLLAHDDPPLPKRIVEWLQANKAQSNDGLLRDLYSALEALRVENLHGTC